MLPHPCWALWYPAAVSRNWPFFGAKEGCSDPLSLGAKPSFARGRPHSFCGPALLVPWHACSQSNWKCYCYTCKRSSRVFSSLLLELCSSPLRGEEPSGEAMGANCLAQTNALFRKNLVIQVMRPHLLISQISLRITGISTLFRRKNFLCGLPLKRFIVSY